MRLLPIRSEPKALPPCSHERVNYIPRHRMQVSSPFDGTGHQMFDTKCMNCGKIVGAVEGWFRL